MGSHASPPMMHQGSNSNPGAFGSNDICRKRVGLDNSSSVEGNWRTVNTNNNHSTSTGRGMFTLPNGLEIEVVIDDDGPKNQEEPIDYCLMVHKPEEQVVSKGSSEHEESSGLESESESESESQHEGPPEQEEGPAEEHKMCKALRSDRAAYGFATREGAEWTDPQADSQQVQEVLDGMSDEQCAIVRVLAHRQTHVALCQMGVSNIDPESEAYLQQYNIMVTSIVGGSMLQS